jgi:predicted DNA-binding WGR domain protein
MKKVYLENTQNHHDKYYQMVENNDGASFTATWGRTGSNGRTQIYGMNEWDKKYREKISKGYENIQSVGSNVTPPSNWIQGMTVAQRKKQGITTVQPLVQPKKVKKKPKAIKKTAKKIHYDVGQVDVEVNHSHQNKIRILHMTMENWAHDDGKNYALDSRQGRMYEADLHKVNDLMEEGREILTKEEMLNMNVLFKIYGGIRKSPITSDELHEDGRE